MPAERQMFALMWEYIKKSIKYVPKKSSFGEFKGEDHLGNKYYELPAQPDIGRRQSSRWYESRSGDYLQELPIEWESWLRRRRDNPPTSAELAKNEQMSRMKKVNAAKLENKIYNETEPKSRYWGTPEGKFPQYKEYERYPGEDSK